MKKIMKRYLLEFCEELLLYSHETENKIKDIFSDVWIREISDSGIVLMSENVKNTGNKQ